MTRFVDTAALLLSIALLTSAARAAEEGEKPPAPAPPTGEEVDAAVARGVEFLRREQRADGSFDRDPGMTALAVFALSHSGVPDDDRAILRGMAAIRAGLSRPDTYSASLAIMAFVTIDREKHAKMIRRLADLVQRSQCRNGQWSYQLRPGRSSGDNSNTQFAVFSLWYARRAGVRIEPKVHERCRKFFEDTQNEDGGWGYSAKERKKSYGSMVATGLASLLACRAGDKGGPLTSESAREGESVRKALDWLGKHFAVDRNPEASFKLGGRMRGVRKEVKDSFWKFYWLWSIERAATIAGVAKLGGREWYPEGARHLVDTQRKDGSWVGSEAPVPATCFALLFLDRATRRAVATEKKEREGGTTTPPPK